MAYEIDFLGGGVRAPLPDFGPGLEGEIVRSDQLRDGVYADYPTYTLVMNARRRSAAFVALNIHQRKLGGEGSRSWTFDTRMEHGHQLNDDYYLHNVWDRGHMAMRASAAWGDSRAERNRNSRETYYWTNSVLQHQWLNRDEWVGVENWVRTLEQDDNDRVCSISGPIYGDVNTYVEPQGRTPAPVPGAFFKVVMFRHRDTPDALSVRAFIVPQNAVTMRATGDWRMADLQTYQVPVRLIEQYTNLVFPEEVVQANPLFFEDADGAARVGVAALPEIREIDADANIVDPGQTRGDEERSRAPVRLLAAMVNPVGSEAAGEWVSLANLGPAPISLEGWKLRDHEGRECALEGTLEVGTARRIQPVARMRLTNRANGSITLLDDGARRVDRAYWKREESRREGETVVFLTQDRFEAPAAADEDSG